MLNGTKKLTWALKLAIELISSADAATSSNCAEDGLVIIIFENLVKFFNYHIQQIPLWWLRIKFAALHLTVNPFHLTFERGGPCCPPSSVRFCRADIEQEFVHRILNFQE